MTVRNEQLKRVLDLLEKTIDPEVERQKRDDWRRFYAGETFEPYFDIDKTYGDPAQPENIPHVNINDAMDDLELMMLRELTGCYHTACKKTPAVMNIRANYGTGILPSLFGVRPYIMDPDLDTLPTNWPFDSADDIKRLVDAGMPELDAALGKKVFQTTAFYTEVLADYPRCREHVHQYHPDLQGPIDVAELLWGSKIFLALIDTPELVRQSLELVTETYVAFLTRWFEMVPEARSGFSAHWGSYVDGNVMLRDDSVVNLSPAMYDEFCRPYEQRVLAAFGGGGDHYCGRGHHVVGSMLEMEGMNVLTISQPHLNDMDHLLNELRRTDTAIVGLGITKEMMDRHDLSRKVHGRLVG